MFKKLVSVGMLFVFALSMIAAAPFSVQSATRLLKGKIVAINTKTHVLTVSPVPGKFVKIKVAATTHFKRQGRVVGFSKLRVGDKTSLNYNPITKQATEVDDFADNYEIHGTVESVDTVANTIVIASEEGGNSVMLKVDANTVIKRNGAATKLANLVAGDKVEAKYNSANMLASSIKSEMEDSDFHGSISALTANTVTVTPNAGGANVVLKVVESTVILRNKTVITMTDLHVGDAVEVEYDSATLIASKIVVNN